jgi:hypothetical protein
MVNIKMGGLKGERVRPQSIRPLIKFPRGISDQVISLRAATAGTGVHLVRASSVKLQASSFKLQASSFRTNLFKHQATSVKPQAASFKRQATSGKLSDFIALIKFQAASIRGLDYNKTILRMTYMEANLVW